MIISKDDEILVFLTKLAFKSDSFKKKSYDDYLSAIGFSKEDIYEVCFNNAWADMSRHTCSEKQYNVLASKLNVKISSGSITDENKQDIKAKFFDEYFNPSKVSVPFNSGILINKIDGWFTSIPDKLTIGQIQKVVNMFFKYLYCFKDLLGLKSGDFNKCDCPVDSIILKAISKARKNEGLAAVSLPTAWSKIDNFVDYNEVQNAIDDLQKRSSKDYGSFRLKFDFLYW